MDIAPALSIVGCPLYVKHAAVNDAGYTFKTREETFVSAVLALVKNASDDTRAEVDGYARFWDIVDDVVGAREKWATAHQEHDPEEHDYALRVEHQGQPIRKFAAFDASSTRDAARAFVDNRHRLPYAWRKEAAVNILGRAQRFDTELPHYAQVALEKSAGYGVMTCEAITAAATQRAELTHRHFADAFDKLSTYLSILRTNEAKRYDGEVVKEAMSALDLYDRSVGISQHYANGRLDLPESIVDDYSVLSVVEKTAAAQIRPGRVTLVNGAEIDVVGLDKHALSVVDITLPTLSEHKLAEVLPTLPREDADLLVRLVG